MGAEHGADFKAAELISRLSEDDIYTYWNLVEAADRAELQAFVNFNVFEAKNIKDIEVNPNIVDGVWVRRWKKGPKTDMSVEFNGTHWFVKSRLCGSGFLDRQNTA